MFERRPVATVKRASQVATGRAANSAVNGARNNPEESGNAARAEEIALEKMHHQWEKQLRRDQMPIDDPIGDFYWSCS